MALFRREQLASVRIVDRTHHGDAVDLERQRRAEDRQSVSVVGRPVDRIEHPAEAGPRGAIAGLLELFAEDGVVGKPLGDHLAERALDFQVHLGYEIDRALLVDPQIATEARHLRLAGADHGLDCGREVDGRKRIRHWSPAS